MPKIVMLMLSLCIAVHSVILVKTEIKWKNIARLSQRGMSRDALPEYDRLYQQWLGKNGLFLYNYAAELHMAGKYEESLAVSAVCTRYFNDMDVQLLLAHNNKELGKYLEAEQHFKTAAAMCPSRFIPLYELAKLYVVSGHTDEAIKLAKKIIDKDVKVSSAMIPSIKHDMQRLIDNPAAYVENQPCDCN